MLFLSDQGSVLNVRRNVRPWRIVLAPRGILPASYQQAAAVLGVPFGRWGFWLFCASLFIGCVGAALELSLDVSYITAQTFGWN